MSLLFEPLKIGNLQLSNRILMGPMTRGRANDAGVQPAFAAKYYAQRASAGMIITEAVNISPLSKSNDNVPGIFTDEQAESWIPVTGAVQKRGGKIFMQLVHTGRLSLPQLLPGGAQPVSASTVAAKWQNYTKNGPQPTVTPRELSITEIAAVVQEYVTAAKNAIRAGFDGVEIHGAFGFLIHQFLGTNSNIRTDAYGGSDEKRARFLFEVVDAVAAAIGPERTGLRLSPGVALHDMEDANAEKFYPWLLRNLSNRRLVYLHAAFPAGAVERHALIRTAYEGTYFANGGYTKETAEQMLENRGADAIVFANQFIANPDLPERFRTNAELAATNPATIYSPGEKGYTDYTYLVPAELI